MIGESVLPSEIPLVFPIRSPPAWSVRRQSKHKNRTSGFSQIYTNRCIHQPGKQRRTAAQHQRRIDRHQHGNLCASPGHWICHSYKPRKTNHFRSDQLRRGRSSHGSGMTVQPLDSNLSNYLNIPKNCRRSWSQQWNRQSPASKQGIEEGDIILFHRWLAIITDISAYHSKINEISADQTISIKIIRKGKNCHSFPSKRRSFHLDRALELASQRLGIKVYLNVDEPSSDQVWHPRANGCPHS
jgi:hypothetical protein